MIESKSQMALVVINDGKPTLVDAQIPISLSYEPPSESEQEEEEKGDGGLGGGDGDDDDAADDVDDGGSSKTPPKRQAKDDKAAHLGEVSAEGEDVLASDADNSGLDSGELKLFFLFFFLFLLFFLNPS